MHKGGSRKHTRPLFISSNLEEEDIPQQKIQNLFDKRERGHNLRED